MFGLTIGTVLSLLSTLVGVLVWYRSLSRSQYERERQMSHLLKNQEQIAHGLHEVLQQIDELGDRLTKQEALFLSVLGRRLNG